MTRISSLFSTAERSGGSPAYLVTIQRGTSVWYYTTARSTQTVEDIDYLPAQLKCSPVAQKKDTPGIQATVTLGLETSAAQALMTETGERASVSIQRTQSAGDPVTVVLLGDVVSLKFVNDAVELTVATIEHHFKTLIPRVLVQRLCPHAVYGYSCGANKDDFAVETTVADIDGQTITVAATEGTHAWRNGILRLASGRVLFIADHSSSQVIVWAPIPSDLAVSDAVTIYRGCDKTFTTCETVFDNAAHYGGFPNLPERNPLLANLR
jgi:uncharacterized phage protein (TIGR02218 family)